MQNSTCEYQVSEALGSFFDLHFLYFDRFEPLDDYQDLRFSIIDFVVVEKFVHV